MIALKKGSAEFLGSPLSGRYFCFAYFSNSPLPFRIFDFFKYSYAGK